MLINDLDKLMEEMREKKQNIPHIDPSIHHTAGILLPTDDNDNISIEPCTGLIEEYNALVGDISSTEENEDKDKDKDKDNNNDNDK